MRLIIPTLALLLALPLPAAAQDRAGTLADIRQQLTMLYGEIQQLRTELSTTGSVMTSGGAAGSLIDRVNVIESELQRLTAKSEELQFRIDRIVSDGTNRIGDLEFRLCELEEGCDIASLGETPSLGGGPLPEGPDNALPEESNGAQMAMGEQADFDRAEAAMEAGDYGAAADLFRGFAETYPAGPLTPRAYLLAGDALAQLGESKPAASAYLEAFSSSPEGPEAPQALLKLGRSLGDLGQIDEACVMLGEIEFRFPQAAEVAAAAETRRRLACP